MLATQKEDAEYLAHAVLAGALPVSAAVSWADAIIQSDSTPDSEVIDVALAAHQSHMEVAILLGRVRGEYEPRRVARRVLRRMLEVLDADPARGAEIARWLHATKCGNGPLSASISDAIYGVEDDYYHALHDDWITLGEAEAGLREALEADIRAANA